LKVKLILKLAKMKYILILIVLLSKLVKSQIVIGDNAGVSPAHNKALLSFTSENMGIILPLINSTAEDATSNNALKVPGVLYVSRKDRQVKVYMSPSPQNPDGLIALTQKLPISITIPSENTYSESLPNAGVIMGASTTTQKGILVLESAEKTLVLPKLGSAKVSPHKSLKDPYIGTIGFSEIENAIFPATKPYKKFLWVYGGGNKSDGQWHLWRAGVEFPFPDDINQDYLNNLP